MLADHGQVHEPEVEDLVLDLLGEDHWVGDAVVGYPRNKLRFNVFSQVLRDAKVQASLKGGKCTLHSRGLINHKKEENGNKHSYFERQHCDLL